MASWRENFLKLQASIYNHKFMKTFFETYREFIPDFDDFLESLNRPIPTHLRINGLKIEPARLVQDLEAKGIHLKKSLAEDETLFWAPNLISPGNLSEYYLVIFIPNP